MGALFPKNEHKFVIIFEEKKEFFIKMLLRNCYVLKEVKKKLILQTSATFLKIWEEESKL